MSRILVIDDDRSILRSLELALELRGHEVRCAATGREGLALEEEFQPQVVFLDQGLPDISGLTVLKRIRSRGSACAVAMITGRQDMEATIEAIRLGAFDAIRKPLDLDDVLLAVEKGKREARPDPVAAAGSGDESREAPPGTLALPRVAIRPHEIVGRDRRIVALLKSIALLSRGRATVLIQGESGTGKELVARAIHEATTPGKPFVAINAAAVVPTLLESELFGHQKGAFTGATEARPGKLELAADGTLLLDEVGDISLDLQAKLLRVLQERVFERVGGNQTLPLRARVLAATSRDLLSMVAAKEFRRDLYYRISVATLDVPPLRERPNDIGLLTAHLLAQINRETGASIRWVHRAVLERLRSYPWPGNVRELENVLTRAVTFCRGETLLEVELPASPAAPAVQAAPGRDRAAPGESTFLPESAADLRPWRDVERDYVRRAVELLDGNVSRAARVLELSPTTVRKKLFDTEATSSKDDPAPDSDRD